MKLTGKPGTGDPDAGFDGAGDGNGQILSTAPLLNPADEGELERELSDPTPALFSTAKLNR
jgi:hypothetical protein